MQSPAVCASFYFVVVFASVLFGVGAALDGSHSDFFAGKLGSFVSGEKTIITDTIINQILNIYAPVSDGFDNDLCRNHGEFYKDSAKKGQLWALKMFDSSSKIPDGVLAGNVAQLGNFDECVEVEDVPSDFGAFSGQHCYVSISSTASSEQVRQRSAVEIVNAYSTRFLHTENYGADSTAKSAGPVAIGSFYWSVCVPSSCRPEDVATHLETALPSNLSVSASALQCYSRAFDHSWKASDWFAVGFVAFFAILVVLSTSYDLMHSHSASRRPVLAAFSVYSNGAKLLSSPTASSDNLACLHGVRVLSMAWVVLGHRYLFSAVSPSINQAVILGYLHDWKHLFITNATISVDSFFLMGGILVCYIFMKEMEKGATFNVFLYYLHRYIRLTPAYAAVILLSATLFCYVGDGPFWQASSELARTTCQQNWWVSLLYVNNYVRPQEQCIGPAWYLAVDMQLFWLSPLVLLPLLKWPKVGKALLGGLIGAGLLIAFLVAYLNEFPVSSVATGDAGTLQYFPTHTRFTPWLIGVGLGYILHVTKDSPARMSNAWVAVGWLLSVGLMLTSWLLAHRFIQFDHKYERAFESIYTALMRPAWALGLAWLIYACVKGYGGFINTFLSWSVFQILGRLTYTVYLIHFTLLIWTYGSMKEPSYISDRNIFMQYFGDMVISFAAAFVLTLVFESPAIIIEKHFLGTASKAVNRPAKKGDTENILQENHQEEEKIRDTAASHD